MPLYGAFVGGNVAAEGAVETASVETIAMPTPSPTPAPTTPAPTRDPLGPLRRHPMWYAEFTVAYGSQRVDQIGSFVIEVDPMLAPLGTGRCVRCCWRRQYVNSI